MATNPFVCHADRPNPGAGAAAKPSSAIGDGYWTSDLPFRQSTSSFLPTLYVERLVVAAHLSLLSPAAGLAALRLA